jgi:hypothetical protein
MSRTLFHRLAWLLVALALPAALGCGPNWTGRVYLTGTVTLDGQPLASGTITFTSLKGGVTSGGRIIMGEYSVNDVSLGENRVVISIVQMSDQVQDIGHYNHGKKWDDYKVLGRKSPTEAQKKAEEEGLISPGFDGADQLRDVDPDRVPFDFHLYSRKSKQKAAEAKP